ncbi:MAG: hypothetical protein AAF626_07300 [Pseudomonadota bacterium]
MKYLLTGVTLIALAGCGDVFGPRAVDTPEVTSGAGDGVWHHVLRGQCVPIEGTPQDEAVAAGGEARVGFEGSGTFTYPVESVYVDDQISAIYVQGTQNCATFVSTVL